MTDLELKTAFVSKLKAMTIPPFLDEVDGRIRQYIEYVRSHAEGEQDENNVDIVAACCKFLRMCNCYEFDAKHVKRYIKMAEQLKLDSLDGKRCYPMTPAQVFIVAGMHGFLHDVTVELYGKTSTDKRKVVQDVILFVARKFGKTQFDAWEALDDFLFGDNDAEVHIVSNSLDQSKIAYRAIRDMLEQLDPDGNQIRMTQQEITWRNGKRAAIYPHTSGGKKKDGAKASKVLGDEAGSAAYIKDHSDFFDAFEVYVSSMGTRKNPYSIITTTAGKVIEGGFEIRCRKAQEDLYKELDAPTDQPMDTDYQFLYACHPDKWECSDEHYGQPNVWKKCNPHVSVTIQPTFYAEQWKKAQSDPEVYKETLTKLFNQFVSDSSRPWIQAEDIRRLQVPMRIDDLNPKDGWVTFCAFDFSHGDDLHTIAYHCCCIKKDNPYFGCYFWDTDVWISEEQLTGNPNATLYKQFIEHGYMHTSQSKVIPSGLLVERLEAVNKVAPILRAGFDAYDATDNLNDIRSWFIMKARERKWNNRQIDEFLKATIVPVSQTWANYSAPSNIAWKLVNADPQKVYVSKSEVLPWVFGNAVLDEDKMGNVKPIKRTANAKVDPVQALISGIKLEMEMRQ